MNLNQIYPSQDCFKAGIIDYLKQAKQFTNESIEEHSLLDITKKMNLGLVINDCYLIESAPQTLCFSIKENLSKIRQGDSVYIYQIDNSNIHTEGEVVDITNISININAKNVLEKNKEYIIELKEIEVYDTFINTLLQSSLNDTEIRFLEQLLGTSTTQPGIFVPLTRLNRFPTQGLESLQAKAIVESCKRPSLYVIQGPPGTGKTKVLADIASNYSNRNLEVAIIANTHFAVNNALNYIKEKYPILNVFKIGKEIKTEGLKSNVHQFSKLSEYLQWNKENKNRTNGSIIGMTLQSSSINLGLRKSNFKPSLLLVDEASQIPLAEGSVLGCYNASTIIFLGDDRQMPPIFQSKLTDHPLSTSIFYRVKEICDDNITTLTTTFRMNSEITEYVSKHFYEPYGIRLISHESAADNKLENEPAIEEITTINRESEDYNLEEACNAIEYIKKVIGQNLKIAVLTPFRRQVNVIRQMFREQIDKSFQDNCIIDTVERLQGQDVDIVIISLCVSDTNYYNEVKNFVENSNRLNVMFSRAKKKVIILKSSLIKL